MTKPVLVTGVSGFLGGHVALSLLQKGYLVRGSVRTPAQGVAVRGMLAAAGADVGRLEIVELDLLRNDGWSAAAQGCGYLLHTASPFVLTMPEDPDVLIRPAVEGTRRAITAALAAGVTRIVLTSSIAAIVHGHRDYDRLLTETDWTDLNAPGLTAYIRSKTLAEQEAWSLVEAAGMRTTLAVICPAGILGPLLSDDAGTTAHLILRMLKGGVPAVPPVSLGWVDVRDVADAHIAAMTSAGSGGERYIVSSENRFLLELAQMIARAFPAYRRKLPRFELPAWIVPIAALFDASLKDVASEMRVRKRTDASKIEALLDRRLMPVEESVLATAQSIMRRGLA